jgi:hypothetical protein
MFKIAKENAKTDDIIYHLGGAVPAAMAQAKNANLPEVIGLSSADIASDGFLTGQWIKNNVTYKIDNFRNQNIQLPSALLRSGFGDCKSLSLLFCSIMNAAGYNCGFRFARYKNGGNFTHVYNIVLDNNNKIYTFDVCTKDLKELQHYKEIKDMNVNYVAGVPLMIQNRARLKRNFENKPTLKQLMSDDRYLSQTMGEVDFIGRKKLFPRLNKFIQKGKNSVKTVAMAPARGSFLVLLNSNYKGLATKLDQALQKNPAKVNEFWVKLGGDKDKLKKAINKGKSKNVKGIFGIGEGEPSGDGGGGGLNFKEIGEAAGAASGIISVVLKLLKSLGIGKKDEKDPLADDASPNGKVHPDLAPGEDFFANDPATPEAQKYAESGGARGLEATNSNVGFKPSPLLLIGGAAAILGVIMLTKKK